MPLLNLVGCEWLLRFCHFSSLRTPLGMIIFDLMILRVFSPCTRAPETSLWKTQNTHLSIAVYAYKIPAPTTWSCYVWGQNGQMWVLLIWPRWNNSRNGTIEALEASHCSARWFLLGLLFPLFDGGGWACAPCFRGRTWQNRVLPSLGIPRRPSVWTGFCWRGRGALLGTLGRRQCHRHLVGRGHS